MKENIADGILSEVVDLIGKASGYLKSEYGKSKPFAKQKVSTAERLYEYDQFRQQPETMDAKIEREGADAVNQYIYEMEQLKKRVGGNNGN